MRLIDADALLDRVPKARFDGEKIDRDGAIIDIISLICSAPTIDAVEVTRCKDCKWFLAGNDGDTFGECMRTRLPFCTYDTAYCFAAKRRDDDAKET